MVSATETRSVAVPGNRLQLHWLGNLETQRSPNIGGFFKGVGNMSTLTTLSDAELDAVNGGFFDFTSVHVTTKIASNFNATSQGQENVGILQAFVVQGGSQSNSTSQSAIA